MRRSPLPPLVLALLLACGGEGAPRDAAVASDDEPRLGAVTDAPSVTLELAQAGVDSLAARACDSAAAIFAATPGETEAGSALVADPEHNVDLAGCLVSLRGSFADVGAAQRPDIVLGARFAAAGWRYDERWSADGPDGTAFVLRKDGVFCIVEGRWDGGDDADPRYLPPPDYAFHVRCANRPHQNTERT